MFRNKRRIALCLVMLAVCMGIYFFIGRGDTQTELPLESDSLTTAAAESSAALDEEESYYSKDDVALYLYLYGHLPPNYITKSQARDLGWESDEGNLWEVAPGCVIGGDYFGNVEGLLPEADGRDYFECDVNYDGGYRDAQRIVYSDDGLIFYTADHYESFTQLYE